MKITKQIVTDGIYGVAVGDALGVPHEFKRRSELDACPCLGMTGGGAHGQRAGTFSDDTSMTVAALWGIAKSPSFDRITDGVMREFRAWYDTGAHSQNGQVFDVGCTCSSAILRYGDGTPADRCGGAGAYANGNGSLMRIMPAVLYSLARFKRIDYGFIDRISALTHAHEISLTACGIYARACELVLLRKPPRECIAAAVADRDRTHLPEFDRLRSPEFASLDRACINSGGYVIDSLEAALWCLCNTDDYRSCVLAAVNLGGDTDTTAAIAGGLAGLMYGARAIPDEWLAAVYECGVLDGAIDAFCSACKIK